jgi:hypothetical protein
VSLFDPFVAVLGAAARSRSSEEAAKRAVAAVADFAARRGSSAWHPSLTREGVAARLGELLADPDLVDQGDLNVCGPATLFHFWFQRDTLATVEYASSLFATGRGRLGDLTVEPGRDLRAQDYGAVARSAAPPADWMMLSALRDWEYDVLDFEGTPAEGASGITRPDELARWMRASGAYQRVDDDGAWVRTKGVTHALALAPSPSCDVAILIHARIIEAAAPGRKKSLLDRFPNHYVRLVEPIAARGRDVTFRYWTWGSAPASATVSVASFEASYYGSVTGHV